jgi:hypothetical protein
VCNCEQEDSITRKWNAAIRSTLTKHSYWKKGSKETRKYSDKSIKIVGCMVEGGAVSQNIVE